MNKSELKITKYEFEKEGVQYNLYLMPQGEMLGFYIEKKGYGNLYHTVGIPMDNMPESLEDFIDNNLDNWIDIADSNIVE